MGRSPDVAHGRAQVTGVHGDLVGERDERRVEGEVAPVGAVPDAQVARRPEGVGLGARALVADVWSPWWCVLTTVRTGAGVIAAIAAW
jgi:hypothetical protein